MASPIRSIQRGSIALAAAGLTDSYELPRPVTPGNCWLILNGVVSAANAIGIYTQACVLLALTGTHVTARRGHSGTVATVHFTVVELESVVVDSIQTGTIDIPAGETSGTASLGITPNANAFLDTTGSAFADGAALPVQAGEYTLTLSGTTVTATLNTPVAADQTYSIGYSVVDLTAAVVRAAHQVVVPFAAGTVFNATIPSVDTARSIIIINGLNHQWASLPTVGNTGGNFISSFGSATQATFTRQASNAAAGTLTAYVIEFAAGALAFGAVQSGSIAQTAPTTTAPIIPVGQDAICFPGGVRQTTGSNANGASVAVTLLNPENVQAASFQIFGTNTCGYYVIDVVEHERATGIIEKIQQVSITIAINALSNFATIEPVNLACAAIFWNGRSTPGNVQMQFASAGVVLTNETTVTATRGMTTNQPITVGVTIVEFVPRVVNSIQYGAIDIEADVSGTYELPMPIIGQAFAINNGTTSPVVSTLQQMEAAVALGAVVGALPSEPEEEELRSSEAETLVNTVTATLGQSQPNTTTVFFCVVDLTSEAVASVQQVMHNIGGSGSVRPVAINPVTMANTILVCGGLANASSNWGNTSFTAELTSPNTITLQKLGTAGVTPYFIIAAVQFQADVLSPNRVQRGATPLINALSATSKLANPVDRTRALCNWCGFRTASPTGAPNSSIVTSLLTDEETQTSAIGLQTANNNITAWEVVEFAASGVIEPEPEAVRHGITVVMA